MRSAEGFCNLISAYHRRRPRFRATVETSVAPAVAVAGVVVGFPQAYDLDDAVGAQLDVVGEWLGYTRFVRYPLPHSWFSWGDAARGWGKGRWRVPEDPKIGITRLDDGIYRRLLKAKVLLNHWDGRVSTAGRIFEVFLDDPDTYPFVVDKQDGRQRLGIAGEIPSLIYLQMLANDYLPARPAGVAARTLVTSVNRTPLFGFGVGNEKIAGWGTGAWAVSPQYLIDHGYATRRPRPTGTRLPKPPEPRFGFGFNNDQIAGFGRGSWSAA